MTTFVLFLVTGITLGCLYALVATGLVTVFRSTHILNFAQADVATFTAFLSWQTFSGSGSPLLLTVIASTLLGAACGLALGYIVRGNPESGAIIALGVGLSLNGLNGAVFGHTPVRIPKPLSDLNFGVAGVEITGYDLLTVAAAVVLIVGLYFAFQYTWIGRSIRASAQNRFAAEAMGVNTKWTDRSVWVAGGMLGAFTAVLAMPLITLSTDSLLQFTIIAFVACAIGGFTSFIGSIVGGLTLGLFSAAYQLYLWPDLQNVSLLVLLLLFLSIRPTGIVREVANDRP